MTGELIVIPILALGLQGTLPPWAATIDLGSIPSSSHTKRLKILVFVASLLDFSIKRDSVKISWQVRLLSLDKALNGIATTFEWLDW